MRKIEKIFRMFSLIDCNTEPQLYLLKEPKFEHYLFLIMVYCLLIVGILIGSEII